MKYNNSIFKVCISSSILMIYLSVALTYLFFLPKFNDTQVKNHITIVALTTASTIKSPAPLLRRDNPSIILHRIYKAIVEHKIVIKIIAFITLITFAKPTIKYKVLAFGVLCRAFFSLLNSDRHTYLLFESLRI